MKYLLPSTLGVGLVEGFNAIGFDRSLSKPHLRREVSLFLFSQLFIVSYMLIDEWKRLSIECS